VKDRKKKREYQKWENCGKKHPGECHKPKGELTESKIDTPKAPEATAKVAQTAMLISQLIQPHIHGSQTV
jgi:hypothetical protein